MTEKDPAQLTTAQEIELELTYLAKAIPEEIKGLAPQQMEDTYFPEDPAVHAQLRVRRKDSTYVVTKKVPAVEGDASVQIETSIPITRVEFESIASGSKRKIMKDRYVTQINGYDAEVDVFKGALEGLVLIDFEFTSVEAKNNFIPPGLCGVEVTNEHIFAAGELSSFGYQNIAATLENFGYTRLQV